MKLADISNEARAQLRGYRFGKPPANGELWYGDKLDKQTGRYFPCCAVCGDGSEFNNTCRDHCHMTGFARGHLCRSCNLAEGRDGGPLWAVWRRHAPWLAERRFHVDQAGRTAQPTYLTVDEVMTLPMAELAVIHFARKYQWTGRSCFPDEGREGFDAYLADARRAS